jgi:hypothetical protein
MLDKEIEQLLICCARAADEISQEHVRMMRYFPDVQWQRIQPPPGGPQRQHRYRNTTPAYQMNNYGVRIFFERFQIALIPLRPVKEMPPVPKSLRDRCPRVPDFPEALQPRTVLIVTSHSRHQAGSRFPRSADANTYGKTIDIEN